MALPPPATTSLLCYQWWLLPVLEVYLKGITGDFPRGAVIKTLGFQCRGDGFHPGQGVKILCPVAGPEKRNHGLPGQPSLVCLQRPADWLSLQQTRGSLSHGWGPHTSVLLAAMQARGAASHGGYSAQDTEQMPRGQGTPVDTWCRVTSGTDGNAISPVGTAHWEKTLCTL